MAHDQDLHQALPALLEELQPRSILCIGETLATPVETYCAAYNDCRLSRLNLQGAAEALTQLGGHDLAVVSELEQLDAKPIGVLLSRLRDLYAKRVLVATPSQAQACHHQLIGLGFSGLTRLTHHEQELELFQFDITTYKTTPDWLNSKNWANPELFDKYRW